MTVAHRLWKDRTDDEDALADHEPFLAGQDLAGGTSRPRNGRAFATVAGDVALVKLEDDDNGAIHFTDIGCKLLDGESCRCRDYPRRRRRVRDCVKLTPATVRSLPWLPTTCAYRMIAEGRDLAWWHPLVSGSDETVHEAGVSVRGRVSAGEEDVPIELWPERIVQWPNKPGRRRK